MADEIPAETFLNAEDQATRVAADLERLARTLASYQASADALVASAATLAALAQLQGEAAAAIRELSSELRRLGVGETQRRLKELTASVGQVGTDVNSLKSVVEIVRAAAHDGVARAATIQKIGIASLAAALASFGLLAWFLASR